MGESPVANSNADGTESRGETPSLLGATRRESILAMLHRDGSVRVSELTETLGVTPVTVRRDIAQLETEGILRRVHGGAVLAKPRDHSQPAGRPGDRHGAATSGSKIGMLVPSLDYYWPSVIEGAQLEAELNSMSIILRGSSYEADDTIAQIEHLTTRGHAEALILAPNMNAPHSGEALDRLAEADVPVVLVERTGMAGPLRNTVESVVSDHAHGAALAMRHLAALGHERIGLVVSGESPTIPHLQKGWGDARRELQIDHHPVVDVAVPWASDSTWDTTVDSILDECLATGTTALLVHADQAAASIVQRCQHRGMSVPGDLSIVAYDDELAELFEPPLTAVRPPRVSLGRAAVKLVVDRMRYPGMPAHRVIITPSLRVRDSTGAPTR
jgi:DNA-binding LacI/PurR family transcriptional regulator